MDEFNRDWLVKKFTEIKNRSLKAVDQLSDEQLNWAPDSISNNIPTLLRHIEGNIKERIRMGIAQEQIDRDREKEFSRTVMTKAEAENMIKQNFDYIINLVKELPADRFTEVQTVRGKDRLNIDMLHQCASHYSEHMGQIFYITKLVMKEKYSSTSV